MKNSLRCCMFTITLFLLRSVDQYAAMKLEISTAQCNDPFLVNSLNHEIKVDFPHINMACIVSSEESMFRNKLPSKVFIPAEGSHVGDIFTSPIPPAITITLSNQHTYSFIVFIGKLIIEECQLEGCWIFKISKPTFDTKKGYSCHVYRGQRIQNIFADPKCFIHSTVQQKLTRKGKLVASEEVYLDDLNNLLKENSRRRSVSSPINIPPTPTMDLSQSAYF